MTPDVTTKAQLNDYQLKNCGKGPPAGNCVTCGPPKLPPEVFRSLKPIPNPEPSKAQDEAGVHKYRSFFELYRKPQPNLFLHVPSVLAGAENTEGRGDFQLKHFKGILWCKACMKPRCVFAPDIHGRRNWAFLLILLICIRDRAQITDLEF